MYTFSGWGWWKGIGGGGQPGDGDDGELGRICLGPCTSGRAGKMQNYPGQEGNGQRWGGYQFWTNLNIWTSPHFFFKLVQNRVANLSIILLWTCWTCPQSCFEPEDNSTKSSSQRILITHSNVLFGVFSFKGEPISKTIVDTRAFVQMTLLVRLF